MPAPAQRSTRRTAHVVSPSPASKSLSVPSAHPMATEPSPAAQAHATWTPSSANEGRAKGRHYTQRSWPRRGGGWSFLFGHCVSLYESCASLHILESEVTAPNYIGFAGLPCNETTSTKCQKRCFGLCPPRRLSTFLWSTLSTVVDRRFALERNVDDLRVASAATAGPPSATCHLHVRSPHA